MVAPASDLLGDLLKSFILSITHQETRDEEHLEGDYFDELKSPEIITNDDACMHDYDLDLSDHVDLPCDPPPLLSLADFTRRRSPPSRNAPSSPRDATSRLAGWPPAPHSRCGA